MSTESTNVGAALWIPEKVHWANGIGAGLFGGTKSRQRRVCKDTRVYIERDITTIGPVQAMLYQSTFTAERPFWIHKVAAYVGKHDDGDHPDDGTPTGQGIRLQLVRVSADESAEGNILDADTRVRIEEETHKDVITAGDEGPFNASHLNIKRLFTGDAVSLNVTQVGSTYSGGILVVTLTLVPYPWPGRDEDA